MSRKGDGSDSEVWTSSDGQMPEGNFHVATIMFRRVLQLKAGARPRVDAANHKQGHVALLEVRAGTISWEVGLPVLTRS
jgi:DNA-directed RNA polymerase subunit K/omega